MKEKIITELATITNGPNIFELQTQGIKLNTLGTILTFGHMLVHFWG